MTVLSFQPTDGSTVSLAVTSVTGRVEIGGQPCAPGQRFQVRLYNAGPDTAFIRFGPSTVVATTANIPIPSGAIEVMTFVVPETTTGAYIAAITASGTATLYLTTGTGI